MKIAPMLMTKVLLLLCVLALPGEGIDWKAFDDPNQSLITGPFAKSIGQLPDADKSAAIKRLRDSLRSSNLEIRRRAALTLKELGDASGVPALIEAFPQSTGRDRDNLAVALRIVKDKRAIPVLLKALKDESAYIRSIALGALGEVKAEGAYDAIVALTKDKGMPPSGKTNGPLNCFRNAPADMACYALGCLGDPRGVPVLLGLLDDKETQSAACQALEVITGQKLGNDAERWKAWGKSQK
jgi:HEAT repeat protein